jgi:subtilase family serine protease
MTTSSPNNATTVSMSWGQFEFEGKQSYDSYFCNIMNGAGQPVTYFAGSGDNNRPLYPAASPCVIAVVGTVLTLSSVVRVN